MFLARWVEFWDEQKKQFHFNEKTNIQHNSSAWCFNAFRAEEEGEHSNRTLQKECHFHLSYVSSVMRSLGEYMRAKLQTNKLCSQFRMGEEEENKCWFFSKEDQIEATIAMFLRVNLNVSKMYINTVWISSYSRPSVEKLPHFNEKYAIVYRK